MIGFVQQVTALMLRSKMKRKRKKLGRSDDLRDLIAQYRPVSPEYADDLEKLIFPSAKRASD